MDKQSGSAELALLLGAWGDPPSGITENELSDWLATLSPTTRATVLSLLDGSGGGW